MRALPAQTTAREDRPSDAAGGHGEDGHESNRTPWPLRVEKECSSNCNDGGLVGGGERKACMLKYVRSPSLETHLLHKNAYKIKDASVFGSYAGIMLRR